MRFSEVIAPCVQSKTPWDYVYFARLDNLMSERFMSQPGDTPRDVKTPLVSIMQCLLKIEYSAFASSYELAMQQMELFFNDVTNLAAIFHIASCGLEIQELANKLETEHKYKNLIWQDGEAVIKKFDIRGLMHFVLLLWHDSEYKPEPVIFDNIKNSETKIECHEFWEKVKRILNKNFADDFNASSPKIRCFDHTTWINGVNLFNSLKRMIEEK